MSASRKGLCLATMLALDAIVLCGCADLPHDGDSPMTAAVRSCMSENKRFTDAWGCVQARYAGIEADGADARSTQVLKSGDDLASQVAAGHLTEAEARRRLLAQLSADSRGTGGVSLWPTSLAGTATP